MNENQSDNQTKLWEYQNGILHALKKNTQKNENYTRYIKPGNWNIVGLTTSWTPSRIRTPGTPAVRTQPMVAPMSLWVPLHFYVYTFVLKESKICYG